MNFPDRVLRTAWRLVLVLLVLAVVLPMAGQFIGSAVAVATGAVTRIVGPLAGSGLVGILFVVFLVGLGVRLIRAVQDPASIRRRQADRDRFRRTARHRAEEIPVHGEARPVPRDDDPTLPFGEA